MNQGTDSSADDDPVVTPAEDGTGATDATRTERSAPETCPVCDCAYDSVSVHDTGLLVNLLDNQRYRRVCFEPIADADGKPLVRFFYHTHDQAALPE